MPGKKTHNHGYILPLRNQCSAFTEVKKSCAPFFLSEEEWQY